MASLTSAGLIAAPGHVIQTVINTKNDEDSAGRSSQTTAKVVDGSGNAEWNGTIDNVLSDSHVRVQMNFRGFGAGNHGTIDAGFGFSMYRGDTLIYEQKEYEYYSRITGGSFVELGVQTHIEFIDTSPGTGSNTYYVGYRSYYTTQGYVVVNSGSTYSPFTCIMQEIAQ